MRLREYGNEFTAPTGHSVDRCVSGRVEVAHGSNLGHDTGGCLPASAQGRGRGRSVKDLEVGAVDELLVGVSVVRDKDKRRKPPVGILLWLSGSPLYCDQ